MQYVHAWVVKFLASIKYFMSFLNGAIFLKVFLKSQHTCRGKQWRSLFSQSLNSIIYISSIATESEIIKSLSGYMHIKLIIFSNLTVTEFNLPPPSKVNMRWGKKSGTSSKEKNKKVTLELKPQLTKDSMLNETRMGFHTWSQQASFLRP